MLTNKVFGAYESDLEFQLVHFASMPLYSEVFNPDNALKSCLKNVYVAESHSKFSRIIVGFLRHVTFPRIQSRQKKKKRKRLTGSR